MLMSERLIVDHLKDQDRREWERKSETERVQWFNEQVDKQHNFLDGPVSAKKTEFSDPEKATEHVKQFCFENGVDVVGVALLDKSYVYKGCTLTHKFAISLGKRMDPQKLKLVPYSSNYECMRVYYELGSATVKLAEHLRGARLSSKSSSSRWRARDDAGESPSDRLDCRSRRAGETWVINQSAAGFLVQAWHGDNRP